MHRPSFNGQHRRGGRAALLALGLGLAIVLSACGGGGGASAASGGSSDAGAVPASALASTQAMTAFVGSLPPDDAQEPLAIGAQVAPVSDTDEPVPL